MSKSWPNSQQLTEALLKMLVKLGGVGNVAELDREVIKVIDLDEELKEVKHSGNRSEIQYRLAWVRTKARQNGLVTKRENKIWAITEKGLEIVNKN